MNKVRFEEFEDSCKKLNQVSDIPLDHLPNHLTREVSTSRELYLNDSEVLVLLALSLRYFEAF